jgi:hypothetical protein
MGVFHLIAFVVGVLLVSKGEEETLVVGIILNCWAWGVI